MTLGERLAHPWLTVRVQIALGVIFIAAALPKIVDPPSFAHMIYNYRILPGPLVNITALMLPWVELIAGVALVFGLWRRSSTAIIGALLAIFIAGISLNLLRDNPIDCGCFDVSAAGKTAAERFHDMRMVILRDIGMLLMVGQIFWATRIEGLETGKRID
ncbi:MAG TPA: MauE/DoxX family redox-associated membrane protein [Thermoanaerobaculia bacterium]|nr:MauE/DoxX family redox-associated membrane protein [Thermoanaerobaculia bacterium]